MKHVYHLVYFLSISSGIVCFWSLSLVWVTKKNNYLFWHYLLFYICFSISVWGMAVKSYINVEPVAFYFLGLLYYLIKFSYVLLIYAIPNFLFAVVEKNYARKWLKYLLFFTFSLILFRSIPYSFFLSIQKVKILNKIGYDISSVAFLLMGILVIIYIGLKLKKTQNIFKRKIFLFFVITLVCFYPLLILDMFQGAIFYGNTYIYAKSIIPTQLQFAPIFYAPIFYFIWNLFVIKYLLQCYFYKKISGKDLKKVTLNYNLSEREQEVFQTLLTDKKNQEIAKDLFISHATVKSHIKNILYKVKVTNRQQLKIKIFGMASLEKMEINPIG